MTKRLKESEFVVKKIIKIIIIIIIEKWSFYAVVRHWRVAEKKSFRSPF